MKMLPKIIAFVLFASLLFVGGTLLVAQEADESVGQDLDETVAHAPDPDLVLHVKGLACEMCALSITNAMNELDGVEEVEVLLEDEQRVQLSVRDGVTFDEQVLREVVEGAGFVLERVEVQGDAGQQSSI